MTPTPHKADNPEGHGTDGLLHSPDIVSKFGFFFLVVLIHLIIVLILEIFVLKRKYGQCNFL